MRAAQFVTSAFEQGTSQDESHEILCILLDSLVRLNLAYLQRHPETPDVYSTGVRYHQEPPGFEQWLTIPKVRQQGWADCEDLAAYDAAWLTFHGTPARCCFKWQRKLYHGKPTTVYHIVVCLPDGTIRDPSRRLGMGWDDNWKAVPLFPRTPADCAAGLARHRA